MPTPVSPGEGQMRLMMLRLVIGCMGLAFAADAGATSWTSAKVPGEQNRAVQGCADDAQNPGDWFCIFIRCDQPGSPLSLYFSAPGPDRKSTRLNSSHANISYAVFCLKKKNTLPTCA